VNGIERPERPARFVHRGVDDFVVDGDDLERVQQVARFR
jgi:hypothetical protein